MGASRQKKDAVLRAIGYELDMLAAAPVMRTTAIVIDPNVSEAQRRIVRYGDLAMVGEPQALAEDDRCKKRQQQRRADDSSQNRRPHSQTKQPHHQNKKPL